MKFEDIVKKVSSFVAAFIVFFIAAGMYLSWKGFVMQPDGRIVLVKQANAAIFDDDALSGEFLQPRQRFDKHFRLLVGAQVGVHVEVESRSFEFFGHSCSISFRSQR